MTSTRLTRLLLGPLLSGWRRWALWVVCIGLLASLGALRAGTDAEMAFASFALLPVLLIAWLGGKEDGLLAAVLAAGMWTFGDLASDRQFSATWIPWANTVTRLMTYGLVAILAAQVRLQFAREHESATVDVLTGLKNRRAFLQAGASEIDRARRYAHPVAVAFLDLDDFKKLNDSSGHDAGDAALRSAASALASALRSGDLVARLGGDEFAILFPEADYDAAIEAGARISSAVNDAMRPFAPVKASLGVAWFGEADRTFPDMLKAADALMYEAKSSRKGEVRTRCFTREQATGVDA